MNAKLPLVLSLAIALMPISSALAQGRRAASSFSRPSGAARSAGVARSAPQFRGAAFRGAAFRGTGAPVQRYNWGASRLNNFSAVNRPGFTGTRPVINRNATVINRTPTNWNRFNTGTTGTNRFGNNWNGTNRFGNNWNGTNRFGSGFNRNGNGWRGGNNWNRGNWWRHHHDHDNNFIFFGAFGFPFFWDYWYPSIYYSAYSPYYAYTPYSYDPYSYGYGSGYPNYPVYGDSGYSDGNGYTDSGYDNGRAYDPRATGDASVVSRVQEQLAHDGYYKGAIDGVAGSRTYYAIRAYERDHHLRVDGEITDELLQEMGLR